MHKDITFKHQNEVSASSRSVEQSMQKLHNSSVGSRGVQVSCASSSAQDDPAQGCFVLNAVLCFVQYFERLKNLWQVFIYKTYTFLP